MTLTRAIEILTIPAAILVIVEMMYLPLAVWSRARRRSPGLHLRHPPLVSVIVPAYNEGVVLARCVDSILADKYDRKEILLVDDGSTDDTWQVMCRYVGNGRVRVFQQENAGKAVALNLGIAHAHGSIVMFVDADGVFAGRTIRAMVAPFDAPKVGAVCGNDSPVNLDRVQPRLLTLLTHVTALVRRALATVNCLTIVSGNCGAIRRDVLTRIGGFTPGLLGEDLELTWRVRAAGYRVAFQAEAIVFAEVPSTVSALWRQRVRWARGYFQTLALHRAKVGNPRYGVFGMYLVLNVVSIVLSPLLQLALVPLVVAATVGGDDRVFFSVPASVAAWILFAMPAVTLIVATTIDGSPRDLRFVYVLLLMPVYSLAMNLVLATALTHQLRHRPSAWNKFARTGVTSRDIAIGPVTH